MLYHTSLDKEISFGIKCHPEAILFLPPEAVPLQRLPLPSSPMVRSTSTPQSDNPQTALSLTNHNAHSFRPFCLRVSA